MEPKLQMTGQMRLEQRMKLAPHMIQSMEILQLPMLALQERIEQELNSNPVLEIEEPAQPDASEGGQQEAASSSEDTAESDSTAAASAASDDDFSDYLSQSDFRSRAQADQTDKKLEAIKNTEAPAMSLHDYLEEQWQLVEAEAPVKKAGSAIIDYIDDKGFLTVRLEQLHNEKSEFSTDDLQKALLLVQKLEPAGMGARDIKECLLIQMANSGEDYSFEAKLVAEHMDALLENRLPDIAKKMNCQIEQINKAVERLGRLDTSPGLQVGPALNHPLVADIIVEQLEDEDDFSVRLASSFSPVLRISDYYTKLARDPATNDKTRLFLENSIRSAKWIIDAVEQRNNTLLRVARSVVRFQRDYFEKGHLFLKPLPMSEIAKDVGVHIATVSRAVAGKYVQCLWGLVPLRKFFSGGTEDVNGNTFSWEAVRAKLQQVVDSEDKSRPLGDDEIRQKLAEAGITNLARRTVAKYRKLMNIPAARFRRKY